MKSWQRTRLINHINIQYNHADLCQKGYPVRSKQFKELSYEKAAYKEVLREIELSEDAPFEMTIEDILDSLGKLYDNAPGNITCFSVGADVIDELKEQWENRTIGRKEVRNAKNKRR